MDKIFSHQSGAELWQGRAEDVLALLRYKNPKIAVIGLFAQEYQPDDHNGHYELIRLGYGDNPRAEPQELKRVSVLAHKASDIVSDRIRAGKSCLSSCAAGLNRSGLVTALTLMKVAGMTPADAIEHVRAHRRPQDGYPALCNPRFVEVIHGLAPVASSKSTWTNWTR